MFGITPDQYPYVAIGALFGMVVILALRNRSLSQQPKARRMERTVFEIPGKKIIEEWTE